MLDLDAVKKRFAELRLAAESMPDDTPQAARDFVEGYYDLTRQLIGEVSQKLQEPAV